MDPRYGDTHLKFLEIGFLSFLGMLVIFRYLSMNKRVCSYPFLVNLSQIGELSLSLVVLRPCYTPEIMHSPTLSFLGKSHSGLRGLICFIHYAFLCNVP